MRLTTIALVLTSLAGAACVGDIGTPRKPGRDGQTDSTGHDGPCAKVEKDFIIRSLADMSALPKTGCYDIYGKLTLQGAAINSLAGLNEINSVNDLDLDHTSLTSIDTKQGQGLGIFGGKLTLTGNTKLTNLKLLSFETEIGRAHV